MTHLMVPHCCLDLVLLMGCSTLVLLGSCLNEGSRGRGAFIFCYARDLKQCCNCLQILLLSRSSEQINYKTDICTEREQAPSLPSKWLGGSPLPSSWSQRAAGGASKLPWNAAILHRLRECCAPCCVREGLSSACSRSGQYSWQGRPLHKKHYLRNAETNHGSGDLCSALVSLADISVRAKCGFRSSKCFVKPRSCSLHL